MDKQAFLKGKKDFKEGSLDNPFFNFNKAREWQRGFDHAYFENLKKVKNEERKTQRRS